MKVIEKVKSTVKPQPMEFDELHVYINKDIREIPESEREDEKAQLAKGQTLVPMFEYTVEQYEKDEYLTAIQQEQISLDTRATMCEDAILEMSEVVYA